MFEKGTDFRKERAKTLGLSALLTLCMGVYYYVFSEVRYETNDDNAMADILYGMSGTAYDPNLIFVNVLIGRFLILLLRLCPMVPWYDILQCSVVLLSFFWLIFLLFSKWGIKKGWFPVLLLTLFFGKEFCMLLQFTKTAAAAVIAGVLLIFYALEHRGEKWAFLVGGASVLIGSMYRFESFLMVLPMLAGVGIMAVWEPLKGRKWKELLCIFLPFIMVFTLCIGVYRYDRRIYSEDREYQKFTEFNWLRAELKDRSFPDYEKNRELYERLNISEEDLAMYKGWDFGDPEIFHTEAMRQLVAAKDPYRVTVREFIWILAWVMARYWFSATLWIAGGLTLFTGDGKKRCLLVYEMLTVMGIEYYFLSVQRAALGRTDAPIILATFMVLAMCGWGELKRIKSLPPAMTAAMFVLAVVVGPKPDIDRNPVKKQAQELIAEDTEHFYFHTTCSELACTPDIFEIYPVGHHGNLMALGGWRTASPTYLATWNRWGVTNPFRDLVDREDMYLLSTTGYETTLRYIQAHYEPTAQAACVKVVEGVYPVYRFFTGNPVKNTQNAIPGEAFLNYDVSVSHSDGETVFTGQIFADDTNSYTSAVYLGITDVKGIETLYCATQVRSEQNDDIMNGAYGTFTAALPQIQEENTVALYLETETELYRVDLGEIAQLH